MYSAKTPGVKSCLIISVHLFQHIYSHPKPLPARGRTNGPYVLSSQPIIQTSQPLRSVMFKIPKEESSYSSREKQIKVFPFCFYNSRQRNIGVEAEGLQAMPQGNETEVRQTEEAPVSSTKKQTTTVFLSYLVHSKPVVFCRSRDDRESIFINSDAHIYRRQYIILSSSGLAGEFFRARVRFVALTIIFLDI